MKIAWTVSRAACSAVALLAAAAWSSGQAQTPQSYMYILMVNMVGPPATSLWETVGAQRLNERDWQRIKEAVTRLSESASAVGIGGTSAGEAERAASGEWKNWAGKLIATTSSAARAVDRKDQMALLAASDTLVEVCEGCHTAFPPELH
jgi:cytochrome c556